MYSVNRLFWNNSIFINEIVDMQTALLMVFLMYFWCISVHWKHCKWICSICGKTSWQRTLSDIVLSDEVLNQSKEIIFVYWQLKCNRIKLSSIELKSYFRVFYWKIWYLERQLFSIHQIWRIFLEIHCTVKMFLNCLCAKKCTRTV